MNVKEWNIIILDDIVKKSLPIMNPEGDYRVDEGSPLAFYTETNRRLLYLKTQSVPRCKHFSSGL
jgi:hypothetical protein